MGQERAQPSQQGQSTEFRFNYIIASILILPLLVLVFFSSLFLLYQRLELPGSSRRVSPLSRRETWTSQKKRFQVMVPREDENEESIADEGHGEDVRVPVKEKTRLHCIYLF